MTPTPEQKIMPGERCAYGFCGKQEKPLDCGLINLVEEQAIKGGQDHKEFFDIHSGRGPFWRRVDWKGLIIRILMQ